MEIKKIIVLQYILYLFLYLITLNTLLLLILHLAEDKCKRFTSFNIE